MNLKINNTMSEQVNKKLNLKLKANLEKQISLISNTEYLNYQYSIEYLIEQLNELYQEELKYQEQFEVGRPLPQKEHESAIIKRIVTI